MGSDAELSPDRIGLVGCVKRKQHRAAPAKDLYVSPMFRGRRAAVEQSCSRWYILSALHGLVEPTTVLEPYDVTLVGAPTSEKRRWAAFVLGAMDRALGNMHGVTFEVYAGADYRNFGLVKGLRERGALIEVPMEHMTQGDQLREFARRARM